MNGVKKLGTILESIQERVDHIGDSLYSTNAIRGRELKSIAFELGGVRAVLDAMEGDLQQPLTHAAENGEAPLPAGA